MPFPFVQVSGRKDRSAACGQEEKGGQSVVLSTNWERLDRLD